MEREYNSDIISVVIPCFNVEEYIEDCIESVFQQNTNIQVICVDNGSSDHTLQKLEVLKRQFPELIVTAESTKGANHARNKGLSLAEGKYIQFLDADDRLKDGKLLHQKNAIKEAAAIVSPYTRRRGVVESSIYPDSNPWKGLFTTRLGITSSALFNTKDVVEVGGWNISLTSSQEYELMFRLLKSNKEIVVDDKLLTIVLDRPSGQISTSDPKPRWRNYLQLRRDIFEELIQNRKDIFDQYSSFFYQAFFDTIHIAYPHCKEEAVNCFNSFIKGKFKVHPSPATSKFFLLMMSIGGFEFAENFKRVIKK